MKQFYVIMTSVAIIVSSSCSNTISSLESNMVYKTSKMGFAQANIYKGIIYSSGQVGWDKNYNLTGKGTFKDQLCQTFINIDEILKEAGSDFNNVIM